MTKNNIIKNHLMGLVVDYIDLKKEIDSEENIKNKEQSDQN